MDNPNIISINTMGGLGNVLFQVAVCYSISIRDNMTPIIDSTNHHGAHHGIQRYTGNILRNFQFTETPLNLEGYGEGGHHYVEIPKLNISTKLHGYFQSEKYFSKYRKQILEIFSPTDIIINNLNEKYGNVLKGNVNSLHIRRGDYVGLPNHHPLTPIDYYKDSVKMLGDDSVYLIFSDDINWCKENLNFIKNKFFVDNLSDYEEIYLMSLCNNNIIANSTFSWWGAWLNQNPNKKVISPKIWFGDALHHNINSDIYCDGWVKL